LWMLSLAAARAQTVAGRVFDGNTRRPLVGVSVAATNGRGAVTDTAGSFVLNAAGGGPLRFSYVGYHPASVVLLGGEDFLLVALRRAEQTLSEVVVTGYEDRRPLAEVAGPVSVVRADDIQRFDRTSLLPALNTLPGVRMEQRAAGSYRLAIRGSQLRARFDVRNVRVYWNDVPLTNPAGNTYLNLVDPVAFGRAEVLKGPSGTLHGAGTGGAVLLYTPDDAPLGTTATLRATVGSYGLYRFGTQVQHRDDHLDLHLTHARQHLNGYRENNELDRDFTDLLVRYRLHDHHTLALHTWYADLEYGIPSGLTAEQAAENPRQARPGSERQRSGLLNRTGQGALIWTFTPHERLAWTTSAYGRTTTFENPFLFDYDRNREQSVGGRSRLAYQPLPMLRLQVGAEAQRGTEAIRTFDNRNGVAVDTALRQADDVTTQLALLFGQADLAPWGDHLRLTAGLSVNQLRYDLLRTAGDDPGTFAQRFDPVWSPRLALVGAPTAGLTLHASVSTGFSPPTLD
ncbi:MAG: TonB-dependent receptor, partial [Catalinimonas sp.]